MIKKLFMLFKIGRKLSTSGAISSIYEIYNPPISIRSLFFIIGFTIGLLATITGIVFGVLFSYYIEDIRILITSLFNVKLFPEEIYFLSKMPSEINPLYIGIIFLFSLLITFLATIFPSLSAAKLDPVKALKYE